MHITEIMEKYLEERGSAFSEEEIKQAFEEKIETPQIIEQEVEMSVFEMKEAIDNNIEVPYPEHLEEYLTFCKERVQKPMRQVVESWLQNPDPFKNHYAKWISNKKLDTAERVDDNKNCQPSLFEERA